MKAAVNHLEPHMDKASSASRGKVVLATVKGDVHDIGKNIVGVVLSCNNYEIIDLGVMVPTQKILETAKKENVDVIGLSGLITPSLDEMVHVASEMEREGFTVPLLIGGATTSRVHTAVKIHPQYNGGPTVHVNDASRAVGVVSALLSKEQRPAYVADIKAEYERVAKRHAEAELEKQRLPLSAARENGFKTDWTNYTPPKPTFLGTKVFESYDLNELARYIDWTPFFQAWEMKGRYPQILESEEQGPAARQLWDDAQNMLREVLQKNWFRPKAVIGFWPANRVEDDIRLFTDESRSEELAMLYTLRQQLSKQKEKPNLALADFVAPAGTPDYIGAFVVTAGLEEQLIAERFERKNDDYSAIVIKALADRFAEAFAEAMHQRVRKEFWGYAPDEDTSPDDLILEKYRGIRPAPGYPAQPDHTEKATLFRLLNAKQRIGVELTEGYAMWPGSSVSGLYFSHPDAYYFGVAKVERDQVEDYSRRKGMATREVERWLGQILNYTPVTEKAGS
jgi:5-methyltetrahydrofolate--homocysteine methyltransferase